MKRLTACAALLIALSGCTAGSAESLTRTEFERTVTDGVHPDDPTAKVSSTCDGGIEKTDGATQDCVITVGQDHSSVHITLRQDGDRFHVDYHPYVTADDLEAALDASLAQQGVRAGPIACPEELDGRHGASVDCDLTAGRRSATVAVRVTEVDGLKVNFHYEVH